MPPYLILQYKPGTGAVGPNATGTPLLEGTPTVGQTLTVTVFGIEDSNGLTTSTFTYQWYSDGSPIGGATSDVFTITNADIGTVLTAVVTFTDDAAIEETLTSAATVAVTAAVGNAVVVDEPDFVTVDGKLIRNQGSGGDVLVVGNTMEARTDLIFDPSSNGQPAGPFTYVWKRGATPISGATSKTYTLQAADAGSTITVDVSFTDPLLTTEVVSETASGTVAASSSNVFTDTAQRIDDYDPIYAISVLAPTVNIALTTPNYYYYVGANGDMNGTPFVVTSVYYDSFGDELYIETDTDLSGVTGLPATVTISDSYATGFVMAPVALYTGYLKTYVAPTTFTRPGIPATALHSGGVARGWDYPGKTIPTIYISENGAYRDFTVDLSEVAILNGFSTLDTEIYWYKNTSGIADPYHVDSTEILAYQGQTTLRLFGEDVAAFVFSLVVLYGNDDGDLEYGVELVSAGYNVDYNGSFSPSGPPPLGWG